MTLARQSGQLSSPVEAPAFPSRPDDTSDAARSEGDGRSGAARSHAQHPLRRGHGEDGEHRTFPGASTVARSAQAGETGGEDLSGFRAAATRSAATAAAIWRDGRPAPGSAPSPGRSRHDRPDPQPDQFPIAHLDQTGRVGWFTAPPAPLER
jgi:hypothetical protein